MKATLTLLTALFLAPLAALHAAEPLIKRTDVFPAGLHGIALYRIPGIVVTPNGSVLAYAEARNNSRSDWGEFKIYLRRSTDGGKTWEPPEHIAHHGTRLEGNPHKKDDVGAHEQTVNNPVAVVDRETGTIEFLYCVNYTRCFSMRSTDDGLTWSKPVDITAAFDPFREKYDWKAIATGPGHGIQLKNGRLVVPIWLAYGKDGDHAPSAVATIYSDDHGKTWQAGEIALPNEGHFKWPNESTITELSDGRVLLVARSASKANRKLTTTSADGATGWTKPFFHDQLWEPQCMASIIAHPSKPGTLIFSNPHRIALDQDGKEIPGGFGKRENLSIKLSWDDGKTWTVNKTIVDHGYSAYSDLGVLQDGTVLCLYEAGTIICARFNLEWIISP
jgi:sialidase-1